MLLLSMHNSNADYYRYRIPLEFQIQASAALPRIHILVYCPHPLLGFGTLVVCEVQWPPDL